MNTLPPSALRTLLFKSSPDELSKVAYTVAETIEAFRQAQGPAKVTPKTVWRLVRAGQLPTRNTGRQYLVSGATIVDVLKCAPEGINDPRDVIDQERTYLVTDLVTILGLDYQSARRLAYAELSPETIGTRLTVTGRAILDYLAGADAPMRHSASA